MKNKEFELSITVRNNLLKEKRLALSLSQRSLSNMVGISLQDYGALESMRISPLRYLPICAVPDCNRSIMFVWGNMCPEHRKQHEGSEFPRKTCWRDVAFALADHYGCEPEDLFPSAILKVTNPKVVLKLDESQVTGFGNLLVANAIDVPQLALPAEEEILKQEEVQQLEVFIESLSPVLQQVIKNRWGIGCEPKTLADIGRMIGRSRERVNQLVEIALSVLRKAYRASVEREAADCR